MLTGSILKYILIVSLIKFNFLIFYFIYSKDLGFIFLHWDTKCNYMHTHILIFLDSLTMKTPLPAGFKLILFF